MIIKPMRLKSGDAVGVIAPASPPNMVDLERGICFLEGMGLKVILGKHLEKSIGYIAGTDNERLEDFHSVFENNEVKAVICARGGYGSAKFANQINYDLIKKNPKIFMGYSDITFLHTAIGRQTGMVTFHGPMVCSDFGQETLSSITYHSIQLLFEPMIMAYTEMISPLETIVEGVARGPVTGGNLTLLTSTLGTKFELDTVGKLLFVEEIGEEPRCVDRMLNQLYMAGKLNHISGFLIGDFHECESKDVKSFTVKEVLDYYIKLVSKPSMSGFKMGHCSPNICIPLGVTATLNTCEKSLEIEAGVL
ncbi:MAG: LD-carboxypeptidase [Bacillota bacterium]|nr:LD-carboxypeptidase [Bacillota bacterium]